MFSIVYRSIALPHFNRNEIKQMVKKAVAFNKKEDITGCLLHYNGKFVQLIEGEKELVTSLYGRIKEDHSHKDIILLNSEPSLFRMFKEWNMIYSNLEDDTERVIQKRSIFESIFHDSEAISTPGRSKLVLWLEVNKLLKLERATKI